jgi:hypothetical protein
VVRHHPRRDRIGQRGPKVEARLVIGEHAGMHARGAALAEQHAAARTGRGDGPASRVRGGSERRRFAERAQLRQCHHRQILRQAVPAQHLAELLPDGVRVLSRRGLAGDAHLEAGCVQQLQPLHGLAEVLEPASCVVHGLIGVVDADPEPHRVRRLPQLRQLVGAADEGRGAIGEHQHGPEAGRMQQDIEDALEDQRLPAGEGEALHAASRGLLQQRRKLRQRRSLDARVAGLAALVAEGTGQVAGGAGMHPQLAQSFQRDRGRCGKGGRGVHGRGW